MSTASRHARERPAQQRVEGIAGVRERSPRVPRRRASRIISVSVAWATLSDGSSMPLSRTLLSRARSAAERAERCDKSCSRLIGSAHPRRGWRVFSLRRSQPPNWCEAQPTRRFSIPAKPTFCTPFAPKRRVADFTAGRLCARRVLERAWVSVDFPLAVNADRTPRWPPGHRRQHQPHERLRLRGRRKRGGRRQHRHRREIVGARNTGTAIGWFSHARESRSVRPTLSRRRTPIVPLRIIFSAKEAFYKCQLSDNAALARL